jgi:hypothetical protein
MITDEELARLRTESLLSGSFVIITSQDGEKFAMFGEYIVDMTTFKVLLLWKVYGNPAHLRIFKQQEIRLEALRQMNRHDKKMYLSENNRIIENLYSKFLTIANEHANGDLIVRYESQIVD